MPDTSRIITRIKSDRDYSHQIRHVQTIPARKAVYRTLKKPLPPVLAKILEKENIKRLYSHQVKALELARKGADCTIVTSTASGKTLCYLLPLLETLLRAQETRALCLFPTKALAQDQLQTLIRFKKTGPSLPIEAGTYDGDTPPATRKKLRDGANVILTNPDMLHSGILPNHAKWANFFSELSFVVIDEIHTYRGIFGSNVANVLRRLRRICRHYGSDPLFICSSATIANPEELSEKLTGKKMTLVNNDGSPRGAKKFLLWNPPLLDESGMERRSSSMEAKNLLAYLISERIQTIAFARARVVTEVVFRYCREELARLSPSAANSIRSYRGGYLPEERRKIEKELFSGKLLGVVSTNALELGINIGSLDAAILIGYPGTIASLWQQAGRAGRGKEDSLAVFIAYNSPIDQYLINHPDFLFEQSPENAIIDPDNPYIAIGHLRSAIFELPLGGAEARLFGEYTPELLRLLEEEGQVKKIRGKYYWSRTGYPAADIGLRNIGDATYTIIDAAAGKNRVIGSIDETSAFSQLHDEAIYLHEGETYFVSRLDLAQKSAYVERMDSDYYTQAISESDIVVQETEKEEPFHRSDICFGSLQVTIATIMFKKIKFGSADSIGYGTLKYPPQVLDTQGFWLIPNRETLSRCRQFSLVPAEGMLGIANVIREVAALRVMCDTMDLGTAIDAKNTGITSLFVYDKFHGGLGFCQKLFDLAEDILEGVLHMIQNCSCPEGCPACVGAPVPPYSATDPDLSATGRIPSKEAALVILHDLLEKEPYIPRSRPCPEEEPEEMIAKGKPLPLEVEKKLRKRLQSGKKTRPHRP